MNETEAASGAKGGCCGVAAASMGGIILLCVLVIALRLGSLMTQVVEDYRPDYQVRSLSRDSLSRVNTSIEHASVSIGLNWSTSDSPQFGRGPYKFRLVVRPTAAEFRAVIIDRVDVASARRPFTITPNNGWPLAIDSIKGAWAEHIFEPALPLDFEGGEEVITRIWYRIVTLTTTASDSAEIRWVPVRMKEFVPIV